MSSVAVGMKFGCIACRCSHLTLEGFVCSVANRECTSVGGEELLKRLQSVANVRYGGKV